MRQSQMDMEGLVAEPASTSITDNMGRRGLQFRQRREINVPKVLGEEVGTLDQRPAVATTCGGGGGGGGSGTTTSRFQPKLYIPERLRAVEKERETQQTGSSMARSSPSFGDQYSKSEPNYYSSRLVHGRDAPAVQPEQNSTVLATSRGLFQLRPRRNIRVKSFDELESDVDSCGKEGRDGSRDRRDGSRDRRDGSRDRRDGSRDRRDETSESSYTTGFLKEQTANNRERLARRGRHSISDMLGGTSTLSTPAPSFDASDVGAGGRGYGLATEADLLHAEQYGTRSAFDDGLAYDRCTQEAVQQPQQRRLEQQLTEPRDLIAGIDDMTEKLRNLDVTIGERPLAAPDRRHLQVAGIHGGSGTDGPCEPATRHHRDDPGVDPAAARPYGHETNASLAGGAFSSSPAPRSLAATGEGQETIDQKKERILRALREQKAASAAAAAVVSTRASDPNFETLEEKKARIFAKLREKHGIEIQTEMLGQPLIPAYGITPLLSAAVTPLVSGAGAVPGFGSQNVPSYQTGACLPLQLLAPSAISQGGVGVSDARSIVSNGEGIHAYQVRDESHTAAGEDISSSGETVGERFGFSELSAGARREDYRTEDVGFDNGYPQRTSPSEDMCSVDSGFHGGDPGREDSPGASLTPPAVQKAAEPEPARTEKMESRPGQNECSENETAPSKLVPEQRRRLEEAQPKDEEECEESNEETLIKPSAVKASGSLVLKKTAPRHPPPATKPKPGKGAEPKTPTNRPPTGANRTAHQSRSQSTAKSQPPRPKSAPPSKSKSVANLSDVVSPSPRSGRRASTSSRDDMSDGGGTAPFSRGSRLRSSTKAWEMRQAEKQAEIRSRMASAKTPPPSRPQTPKKPTIAGRVSLSPERAAEQLAAAGAERPKHTPRSSSNYEKPWRAGTVLASKAGAGSFLIRSAQPEKSAVPERPRKPTSNPSSRGSSRAPSPCARPRNPSKTAPTSDSTKHKNK